MRGSNFCQIFNPGYQALYLHNLLMHGALGAGEGPGVAPLHWEMDCAGEGQPLTPFSTTKLQKSEISARKTNGFILLCVGVELRTGWAHSEGFLRVVFVTHYTQSFKHINFHRIVLP